MPEESRNKSWHCSKGNTSTCDHNNLVLAAKSLVGRTAFEKGHIAVETQQEVELRDIDQRWAVDVDCKPRRDDRKVL